MPLRLKNKQIFDMAALIRAAFLPADFTLLLLRVDRDSNDYVAPSEVYPLAVAQVVKAANGELWWRELLRAACELRPGDTALIAFAKMVELEAVTVDAAAGAVNPVVITGRRLELKIKDSQSTVDIVTWRTRLGEIERRVCRIEYPPATPKGTGFLVGPDLVLTNYHVVRRIKSGEIRPEDVALRFDYKVLSDGVSLSAGKTCSLATSWLVDDSPYSQRDFEVAPQADPAADELDYALLRVNGRPGDDPLAGDEGGRNRGWIQLPHDTYDFTKNKALYIVQHPDGKPMQVAIDSDAVIGLNTGGNRIRYTTTTQPGSSGSPCFGPDWEWVALHQSGDPNYWETGAKPTYNQGIPASVIIKLLKARGKDPSSGATIAGN